MGEKSKKTLAILYVVGFILGFWFVNTTLNTENVKVMTKGEVETKTEPSAVKVNLDVKSGENTKISTYELTNTESVYDLLHLARKSGSVYFETTEYSDRIYVEFIGYKFNMLLDGNDITNLLKETKLVDGKTYTLILTPTRNEVPQ